MTALNGVTTGVTCNGDDVTFSTHRIILFQIQIRMNKTTSESVQAPVIFYIISVYIRLSKILSFLSRGLK